MAFPGERLFLVFSFDPCPIAALSIDRIDLGSQAKDITTLWSCVWPEHLVPGVDGPAGCRVLLLLILRRRVSLNSATAGLIGFLLGYAPVIVFNLTHRF